MQQNFAKLSARPLLLENFNYNEKGAGFLLDNDGLGYATLKSFEVLVDNQPQTDWAAMFHALGFTARRIEAQVTPHRNEILLLLHVRRLLGNEMA